MRLGHLSGGTCGTGAMVTGTRSNALWGKGRRRYPLLVFTFVAVAASVVAGSTAAGPPAQSSGVVPDSLRDKAKAHPKDAFHVVIQTADGSKLDGLDSTVREAQKKHPGNAKGLTKKFKQIGSATAEVTGDQIADIAAAKGVVSVTEDAPIQATAYGNLQNWPASIGAQWGDAAEKDRVSRRSRSSTRASSGAATSAGGSSARSTSRPTGTNSPGDGFGHGTLVAGLAVGDADRFTGVEPHAEHRVARRPRRRRQRDGEQPTGRLRLDPPEQEQVQHRCRELLDQRIERRGSAERSARQGGREAVAERSRRRRRVGELRDRRGRERRRVRARERPVRDHGRCLRHERNRDTERTTSRRRGRHGDRRRTASASRSSRHPGACSTGRCRWTRRCSPATPRERSPTGTCGCRGHRSPPRSSREQPRRCSRGIRTGHRIRSRAH